MASIEFERNLETHLASKPNLKPHEAKLLRVLGLPKSNARRKRVMDRVEDGAKAKLQEQGISAKWGNIDWAALLSQLVAFIKAILALFV